MVICSARGAPLGVAGRRARRARRPARARSRPRRVRGASRRSRRRPADGRRRRRRPCRAAPSRAPACRVKSEPIAVMCVPGCTHSASTTGSRDGVVVTTSCEPRTARLDVARDGDLDAVQVAHLVCVGLARRSATRRRRGRGCPDAEERFELVPRLAARADDRRLLDLRRREQVGCERSCGAGAQLREVAVVEEDRARIPVSAEKTRKRPFVSGRPRSGLPQKPVAAFTAQYSEPWMCAPFRCASPFASGNAKSMFAGSVRAPRCERCEGGLHALERFGRTDERANVCFAQREIPQASDAPDALERAMRRRLPRPSRGRRRACRPSARRRCSGCRPRARAASSSSRPPASTTSEFGDSSTSRSSSVNCASDAPSRARRRALSRACRYDAQRAS